MSFDQIMSLCSIVIMPVFFLLAGWWYSRHTKKRDAKEAEEKRLKAEAAQARDKKLDNITSSLNEITVKLEKSEKFDEATLKDLHKLWDMNRLQCQNQAALAELVMTLAEGLRDQHLDGNITAAVEKYRAHEQTTLQSVLNGQIVVGGSLETESIQ